MNWRAWTLSALRAVLPFAMGLVICAGIVLMAGQSPLVAARALIEGSVGTSSRLAETGTRWIPLILTGLSVALAFRAGFFNIGADGQFMIGALVATACANKLGWSWPLVATAGAVGGGAYALIPGWLKIKRKAPEIITTIMLNYIALQIVAFALRLPQDVTGTNGETKFHDSGGWLLEKSHTMPQSDVIPDRAQVPVLMHNTDLHIGLIVAILAAFATWWLLFHTEWGFRWRAAGEGPLAARIFGMRVERNAYTVIGLSGALAGLGGALEVAGVTKQLGLENFGYGSTAIAVALTGGLNPLGVLPAALVFAALSTGGLRMESKADVPAVAVSVIIGVVVLVLAVAPRLRARTG